MNKLLTSLEDELILSMDCIEMACPNLTKDQKDVIRIELNTMFNFGRLRERKNDK